MAKPPEAPLAQEKVHRRNPSTSESVVVGYMVLPLDIQDTPQAAHVEDVESTVLAHAGGPCLTAIKERAEDAHPLDPSGSTPVGSIWPWWLMLSLCACYFSVEAQVHGDGGAKINELIYHIQGVVIDLDGGSLTDILCTDIGLFDADGEAKVFV